MNRAAAACGRVAGLCVSRPWWVVGAALVVLVLSVGAVGRMRVSGSLEAMLGRVSPAARGLHRVNEEYRAGEGLLVLVEGGVPRAVEAGVTRLREAVLADPVTGPMIVSAEFKPDPAVGRYLRDVAVPAAPYFLGEEGARELVRRLEPERLASQFARNEALISAPGPSGGALAEAVLRDPLRLFELLPERFGRGGMAQDGDGGEWSRDGPALLLRVTPRFPVQDLDSSGALYAGVGRVAGEVVREPLRAKIGGACAVAAYSSRMIRRDAIVSTILSVALVYGLFAVFYRAWWPPLLIGITAGLGMLAAFGVYALIRTEVSPLAATVAALLAGLGVDYGTHLTAHFDTLRSQGMDARAAAIEASRDTAVPIITNCITSIMGFASLWPSGIPMLSDFARLGALGLLGCLIATFTVLPALLVLTHRRAAPPAPARFGFIADAIGARPRGVLGVTAAALLVLVGAAGLGGFVPRLEGSLTVLHPSPNPALSATDEAVGRFAALGEVMPVLVAVPTSAELVGRAFDAARAMESPVCRAVGVADVLGLPALLPDPRGVEGVKRVLASVDREAALRAFDRALIDSAFEPSVYAGYREMLSKMLSAAGPPGLADLPPSVAARVLPADAGGEPRETLLVVRFDRTLRDQESRGAAVTALQRALAGQEGVTLAGLPAVSEDLERAVRTGLPLSILVSVGLVLGWLVLVFRRASDVLLALTPLLIAGIGTVAFIVATGQKLNPINCVAIPLLDGIAVDAGVYLVTMARREHGGRAALRPTVHAVLLAVLTTVTGFAALGVTHTPAVRSMGLVAAVGIALSGVGALGVLLPVLLLRRRSD